MTSMGHYLFRLLASIIALLAGIALFNWFINPYGYFDAPRLKGINEKSLGFNHRLRLAKALAIDKIRPATVIVGNSRAEAGYDADHPGITERPAYNLAMGGAGLEEVYRYILDALDTGQLRHLIIGADFFMFDPSRWSQMPRDESILMTNSSGSRKKQFHTWGRKARILLSGDSLTDSWWSLTHQTKQVAIYLGSGLRDDASDIEQVIREGGHRQAALNVESNFLATALRDFDLPASQANYKKSLATFRKIVAVAHSRNIRLTVIINPAHARSAYLFRSAGLEHAHESWKHDLLTILLETGQINSTSAFWDFSGVSPCTSEALPPLGDTSTRMTWYRESSHFRAALGSAVVNKVFMNRETACPLFGERISDAASLKHQLKAQREALSQWVVDHPIDALEIDRMVHQFGRGIHATPTSRQ